MIFHPQSMCPRLASLVLFALGSSASALTVSINEVMADNLTAIPTGPHSSFKLDANGGTVTPDQSGTQRDVGAYGIQATYLSIGTGD